MNPHLQTGVPKRTDSMTSFPRFPFESMLSSVSGIKTDILIVFFLQRFYYAILVLARTIEVDICAKDSFLNKEAVGVASSFLIFMLVSPNLSTLAWSTVAGNLEVFSFSITLEQTLTISRNKLTNLASF